MRTVQMASLFILLFTLNINSYSNAALPSDTARGDGLVKPLRIYNTTRLTAEKPVIDGVLNDRCWETGEWVTDYIQWIPKEGAKASQPTFLKILYDDKNVYIAIRAVDHEPNKIHRKSGRRDEFNGDIVGVCFDSYHDRRTGFEFDVTAAGQKMDALLTNPTNSDLNWNAVWQGKTAMEDSAWTVEMEIPLSQLRYSGDDEQVWGMHAWRWIDRLQEESDWEPQSSTGPGMLYLFGEIHGIKGLKKSRRFELMPYALGKLETFHKDAANPFAKTGRKASGNIGLDAKIGVSSNFTVDMTVNPDFGQVESDPSVMNLTAFETFYEEKRPFFLEGRNIFNYDFDDVSIFYSRRIGHTPTNKPDLGTNEYLDFPNNTTILSAEKFSGKTAKGLSVGVMHSLTNTEYGTLNTLGSDQKFTAEPLTNYVVARVQKDFNQSNTVLGGIFTSTNRFIKSTDVDFMNRNAFTGGLDLLHYWKNKKYYVDARVIGSSINGNAKAITDLQTSSARYYQRPDANYVHLDSSLTQLSGLGGKVKIGKGSGLWRYSTEVSWRTPGLDLNDIGYMQTADQIKQKNSVSYFVNKPVGIFRTYSLGLNQENYWDFGLNHLSSGVTANTYFEFLNNWAFSPAISYYGSGLDDKILRGGSSMKMPSNVAVYLYARTDFSRPVYFFVSNSFSFAGNNQAKTFSLQPGIGSQPFSALKFTLNLNYATNTDELQYIDTKTVNSAPRYIFGTIDQKTLGFTFKLDYIITPEISLQYYGSPFASVGKYKDFKNITKPKDANYNSRFQLIHPVLNGTDLNVDENGDNAPEYSFSNPNFNFYQFRSNLVFRWEFRPGSQFYLVWSSDRTGDPSPKIYGLGDMGNRISNTFPTNIFLIKFNYWFSL